MSSKDHRADHEPRMDVPSEEGHGTLGRRSFNVAGMALTAASLMTLSAAAQAQQREERTRVSRNRATLERYYSALQNKNADALRSAVEEGFAPDAVLRISDSLPYGGTHAGRDVILTMLMGFVTTTTPIIRPEQIKIERMVEEGDSIVAKAVFPWLAPGAREPIPMSAFEWFVFRNGRISEMVVSYWDTAACLAAMKAAGSKP
ncbi:nuclear transport factor 2 family protein [uncultured Methylibium sp.]|uniref:nuclear transport factor 2 family protein n=1 Tax=uncultured Methylibium sp. TaxID=381093 RepID=UPI0025FED9B7|nr:nuclear transport factor 2 family protein [uncultured Methylibium sp.]